MSCTGKPLGMAIQHADAITRKEAYDSIKKKYLDPLLSRGRSEVSEISCDTTEFLKLMNTLKNKAKPNGGIRIYFAAYQLTGSAYNDDFVPKDMEDMLTLVFAPTDTHGTDISDIGEFYIIDQVSGGKGVLLKDKTVASGWVRNYQDNKLPVLTKRLGRSDTKSLWYNVDDFSEFIAEIECQINTGIKISVIKISMAAFNTNETMLAKLPGSTDSIFVGSQLTLLFSPIEQIISGEEVLLEMSAERTPKTVIEIDPSDYDTGIPIPPAGSGGSSLP